VYRIQVQWNDRIGDRLAIPLIFEPGDALLIGLVQHGVLHIHTAVESITDSYTLDMTDSPFDPHGHTRSNRIEHVNLYSSNDRLGVEQGTPA
jgi:hypothetical protein